MKISAVTPFVMKAGSPSETAWSAAGMSSAGSRHWCFVRIDTDVGISGVGEGSGWPLVVATAIADLGTLLIGEDPRHIDRLWHKLFVAQMGHGQTGTVGGGALSGLDMALWDLNAKALGVPLWRLLGGKFRDRVRCYAHASSTEAARAAVQRGYDALKTGNVRDAAAKVASFRTEFGRDLDLAVDLHGPPWLTAADAIRTARALEPHDLLFLEDPVAPEDTAGWRRVRDATSIPLAAGERAATLWGIRPMIEGGLVDIVQPDPGRVGGITQLRKIAALAEAFGVSVAPHAGTLGPVAEFAAIHFLASIPNALIHERFLDDWPGRERVVTHVIEVVDGHAVVPDRPGLGVDLVDAVISEHPPGVNVKDPATGASAYEAGTASEHLYVQPRRRRATFFSQQPRSRDDP